MPRKQHAVKISFSDTVDFDRAQEIVGHMLEKIPPQISYKKHGVIDRNKMREWRKSMTSLTIYSSARGSWRAVLSFSSEGDAVVFENHLNEYLYKNRKLNEEIILIE